MKRVAILVRSHGRPCLARTLASLARQGEPVDVIVVNAKGGRHAGLGVYGRRLGAVLMNMDGPALAPIDALAMGLQRCQAEFVAILDEGSTVSERHLTGLLQRCDAAVQAVYSGFEVASADGLFSARFDSTLDAAALIGSVVAPLGAFLFRRDALVGIAGAPPSGSVGDLDLLLDFIAALRTAHCPGETTRIEYRSRPAGDRERETLARKRAADPAFVEAVLLAAERRGEALVRLARERSAGAIGAEARDLTIRGLLDELRTMETSRSWKVTLPIRKARYAAMYIIGAWRSLLRRIGQRLGGRDYSAWIRRFDTPSAAARQGWAGEAADLVSAPEFVILLRGGQADPKAAARTVESLRRQALPTWKTAWAAASSVPGDALEAAAVDEPRIVAGASAEGFAAEALAGQRGDWLVLLEPGDALEERALLRLAQTARSRPDALAIYADEDSSDYAGKRTDPRFKPAWNYDLLLSGNYPGRPLALKTSAVRRLGGLPDGASESALLEVMLKLYESGPDGSVVHVAEILNHRLSPEGMTADAKENLSHRAAIVRAHLARVDAHADVEEIPEGLHIRYRLPDPPPLATIIIPTRNGLSLLSQCIDSIRIRTRYAAFEILVVDNGSDDRQTLDYLERQSAAGTIRVLRDDRPFNYSALNNAAAHVADGELLVLLNNDIEVISPDWLDEMAGIALQPGVGAVGARLWYPDDRLQHGGVILGIGGVAGHAHRFLPKGSPGYMRRAALRQSMSAVTAACLAVRKDIFEEVGGLDEDNLAVACNDVDFCLRLTTAGYRNVWTPHADLYHHESATRGHENTPGKHARFRKERAYMQRRWGRQLVEDPAYNPNLSLDVEDFSLPRTRRSLVPA